MKTKESSTFITIKKLKKLIREELKGNSFCACVYMGEGEEILSFFTGSKKECLAKVTKMAHLLNTSVISLTGLEIGDYDDTDGACLVLPAGDPQIKGECISVIEKSRGNAYGADNIMFNYPDGDMDGAFEPVEKSQFKVGQPIIFAQFVGNVPGGWNVVDAALTRVEYWQLGGDSDDEDFDSEDRDEEEFAQAKQTLKRALGIAPEDEDLPPSSKKKSPLN